MTLPSQKERKPCMDEPCMGKPSGATGKALHETFAPDMGPFVASDSRHSAPCALDSGSGGAPMKLNDVRIP